MNWFNTLFQAVTGTSTADLQKQIDTAEQQLTAVIGVVIVLMIVMVVELAILIAQAKRA